MNTELLGKIAEFLEKQEMLSKLTESESAHGYGVSEMHTIMAIGKMEAPNVSGVAQYLNMTKGAISKITKRLIAAEAVEPYNIAGNKQKVFFRLTEAGRQLYEEHEKRHKLWLERDDQFLRRFSSRQLAEITTFITQFNEYLNQQIEEMGGKDNVG